MAVVLWLLLKWETLAFGCSMMEVLICIGQLLQCHLEIMFSNKIYIVMSFVRQVTQNCKIMWGLIIITIQISNHQETGLENSNQFAVCSHKWVRCGIAEFFFQRTRHNTMHYKWDAKFSAIPLHTSNTALKHVELQLIGSIEA